MIINKKFFEKASIIFIGICSFIGYIIGNLYIILFLATFLAIISKLLDNNQKINITINDILWILCLVISTLSIIYSIDKEETINFIFMLVCCIILKILIHNSDYTGKYIIKIFYTFSTIHVIFTLLYKINPNFMINICRKILSPISFNTNIIQYNEGYIAGITGQVGVNVFYISIFIGIIFSKFLYKKKNNVLNILGLVMGFYALTLTGKRGVLIASLISCLLLVIIMKKNTKQGIIKILLVVLLVSILAVVFINLQNTNGMISKFKAFQNSQDITNGREEIWRITIENFKNNMIFGSGANSVAKISGDLSHNIYIQLLSDLGIIGFTIFIIAFIVTFYQSIKLLRNKIKLRRNYDDLYVIAFSIYLQSVFLIYGFSGNPLYGVIFFVPYITSVSIIDNYKYKKEVN